MKIIIFSPTSTRLDHSPRAAPYGYGAADHTLFTLAHTLASIQNHEVHVYAPIQTAQNGLYGRWKPWEDLLGAEEQKCDLFIQYRKAWLIPNSVKARKKVFYAQDDVDTPAFQAITKDYFAPFDTIIALSEYHKRRMLDAWDLPEHKILIIGNCTEEHQPLRIREKGKCVYASTPYRGLAVLARVWNEIKAQVPHATLHVYSSMTIYGASYLDVHFTKMYEDLARMSGVTVHGSRPREEVLEAIGTSQLVLYPNTYPETFCNVINEAVVCRTPFVTSTLGALPETGRGRGEFIEGDPVSKDYQKKFVNTTVSLLTIPGLYESFRDDYLNTNMGRVLKDYVHDIRLLEETLCR